MVVEMEFGTAQWSKTVCPRPHMSASEWNKDQLTLSLHFGKVRKTEVVGMKQL